MGTRRTDEVSALLAEARAATTETGEAAEKGTQEGGAGGDLIRVGFLSGLTILEHRVTEALAPLAAGVSIERMAKILPDEARLVEILSEVRLLLVGPDIAFDEALAAVRAVHAAAPALPVVLIREEDNIRFVKEAGKAGAQAYVLFPIDAAVLREQVKGLFARSTLSRVPVKDLAVPAVEVRETEAVSVVATRFAEKNLSGAAVVNGTGRVVGFISSKDILVAYRLRGTPAGEMPVSTFMARYPITLEEEARLDTAIDLFVRHGLHLIPIVKGGKPVGVLLRLDALRAVLAAE